jgi:CHAT domain-containing protein/tetratricopeptide (TPR) repeat protein
MCALAESRGDLDTAETLCGREIEFFERTEPESPYTISLLNQLAILAARRGYFQRAEGLMLRVLEFVEAEAPGGLMEAYMRFNLGSLALEKGDLELAASRIRSGRKLIAKVAPQDQRFQASAANNLGLIAGCQERWAEAEEHHRQALELRRQLGDALEVAASLDALAETALKKGDLVQAETCLGEELQITEHEAPNSLKSASTLHNLGVLGRRQGRHKEARELLQAALELRRRLSPGSTAEAETLHELALLGREAGRTNEALAAYRAAVTALEAQTERVGGGHEQRFRYRAAHQAVYGELVDLLLELGRKEDAFAALEHSRAQGFLAMLAERDLVFDAEIPPALDRERRQANARYNALLDQLAEHAATNGQAIAEIEAELMEVRALKQRVREQIRTSSPGLAQLTDPTVVDAARARELIEANELLLSFHVGPDRTWLFALTNERLDAFAIAVTADELTAKVETFRGLATARAEEALVRRAGAALYELLLAPGEALIEPSEKLVIIPDGPLQVLPFGILVRSPSDAEAPYLIQHHPLTMVSSASVLEWLRNRATRKAIRRAVVFADPTVDGTTDSPTGPRYRSAGVGRLPASRGEAEVLLDLWGADTRTFMGSQATEEHAKSLPRQSDLLHFATHVLVDTRRALDSAIVLAAPHADDREDGLLQAWEILESVRVDARLVTLSGCNTALGEVLPGEGLLGLVRSFHYAGAEAVVASLWPVEDLASAELMRRFYAGIRSGSPPSEALRRAQLELSSGKVQLPDPRPGSFIEKLLGGRRTINASHPFFWAGFVVHGHG